MPFVGIAVVELIEESGIADVWGVALVTVLELVFVALFVVLAETYKTSENVVTNKTKKCNQT